MEHLVIWIIMCRADLIGAWVFFSTANSSKWILALPDMTSQQSDTAWNQRKLQEMVVAYFSSAQEMPIILDLGSII